MTLPPDEDEAGSRVVSLRCVHTPRGGCCEWHQHAFLEFTLTAEGTSVNGYAGGKRRVPPHTLFLFHPGERHGYWNVAEETPRFWVLHFTGTARWGKELAALWCPDPRRRIWQLTADQAASFQWFFLKLFGEHTQDRAHRPAAESAWLLLLLVSVQRWAEGGSAPAPLPDTGGSGELLQLWQTVNACAGDPARFHRQIDLIPNYDSVRHRFKKTFGCSPMTMLRRARMEQAKNLLLESARSIKEIAAQLGYARQHEFTRTFHKHVGVSPSGWRARPVVGFPAGAASPAAASAGPPSLPRAG